MLRFDLIIEGRLFNEAALAGGVQCGIVLAGILLAWNLMKRHVLIYGLIGGLLICLLKWTEYRFLVIEHSIEIYGGLTAAIFAGLGIWLGLKLTGRQQKIVVKEVPVPGGEALRSRREKTRRTWASRRANWKFLN